MTSIKLFETKQVRSLWDEGKEAWFFGIVDVVAVLTDSVDAPARTRLGSNIAARFAGAGLTEPLAELHGQTIEPMSLGA